MHRPIYEFVFTAITVAATGLPLGTPTANAQPQNFQNPNLGFGPGPGNNAAVGVGPQNSAGAPGGGANADFDSLIDLIVSTVASETWAENGGGEAEIRPFPTGVLVDAAGTLQLAKAAAPSPELAERRGTAPRMESRAGANPRRASTLRYVSLPRLEREIIRRQDAHQPLDPALLTLAGLQRVRYVFVYPETRDLVLAGPAGDWRVDPSGRLVSADNGRPIVRLDDLLTLLRRARPSPESFFGCAINPRQRALAETQAYLDRTSSETT